MKCIIYTRVSTEDQTVLNQIEQLKAYAQKQSWEIVDIVTDVCSGEKSATDRRGLKRVFADARQRKFDILLFWSLDRLSREGSRSTLEYLTKLDACRVKWHSYTEEYISSLGVFADAIIALMACLAKQERIRISERTKAGMQRLRIRGVKLGRPKISDDAKVHELRRAGLSMAQVAKETGLSKTRVFQILHFQ